MPSTVETPEGYEVVPGRSQEKALGLLQAARDLGFDVHTVTTRPRTDEYVVPKEVADKYREATKADLPDTEDGTSTRWVPNEDTEEQRKTLDSGTRDEDGSDAVSEQIARGEAADDESTDDTESVEGDETVEDEDSTDNVVENPVPAKSQSKQDWFDYAKANGFEGEYDDITKDALIEKYGTAN